MLKSDNTDADADPGKSLTTNPKSKFSILEIKHFFSRMSKCNVAKEVFACLKFALLEIIGGFKCLPWDTASIVCNVFELAPPNAPLYEFVVGLPLSSRCLNRTTQPLLVLVRNCV